MGVRSLGGSGKIYNDIRAESGFIDHIPIFEPVSSTPYPTLSAFTDSSDGRYDARIFISGNDMNIIDWQTGSKVTRSLDYNSSNGTITAGNSDLPSGTSGAQTGSLNIPSSGGADNWIGTDTAWKNTGAISIAMWFKTTDTTNQVYLWHTQSVGDMPLVNSCQDIRMHPENSHYADWRPSSSSVANLNNGSWRHMVFVQNGSNDRYWYIDGVQRQENVNQTNSYNSQGWNSSGSEVTLFGRRGGGTGRGQYIGNSYGIRVFDFAISQAQATALYNAKV